MPKVGDIWADLSLRTTGFTLGLNKAVSESEKTASKIQNAMSVNNKKFVKAGFESSRLGMTTLIRSMEDLGAVSGKTFNSMAKGWKALPKSMSYAQAALRTAERTVQRMELAKKLPAHQAAEIRRRLELQRLREVERMPAEKLGGLFSREEQMESQISRVTAAAQQAAKLREAYLATPKGRKEADQREATAEARLKTIQAELKASGQSHSLQQAAIQSEQAVTEAVKETATAQTQKGKATSKAASAHKKAADVAKASQKEVSKAVEETTEATKMGRKEEQKFSRMVKKIFGTKSKFVKGTEADPELAAQALKDQQEGLDKALAAANKRREKEAGKAKRLAEAEKKAAERQAQVVAKAKAGTLGTGEAHLPPQVVKPTDAEMQRRQAIEDEAKRQYIAQQKARAAEEDAVFTEKSAKAAQVQAVATNETLNATERKVALEKEYLAQVTRLIQERMAKGESGAFTKEIDQSARLAAMEKLGLKAPPPGDEQAPPEKTAERHETAAKRVSNAWEKAANVVKTAKGEFVDASTGEIMATEQEILAEQKAEAARSAAAKQAASAKAGASATVAASQEAAAAVKGSAEQIAAAQQSAATQGAEAHKQAAQRIATAYSTSTAQVVRQTATGLTKIRELSRTMEIVQRRALMIGDTIRKQQRVVALGGAGKVWKSWVPDVDVAPIQDAASRAAEAWERAGGQASSAWVRGMGITQEAVHAAEKETRRAARKAEQHLKRATWNVRGYIKDTGRVITGILISQAFYRLIRAIRDAVAAMNEFYQAMEQARIAFTMLMRDADEASLFMRALEDFAAITPYSIDMARDYARQLLALGFAADTIIPTLRTLSDAAAAAGGEPEKMESAVLALGRMKALGRVTERELRMFATAGIPIYDILREELDLTEEQMKRIGALGLDAEMTIAAILSGMEKRFGGASAYMEKTWKGMMSTIGDNLRLIGIELFREPYQRFVAFVEKVRDKLMTLREAIREQGVGGFFEALVPPKLQGLIRSLVASLAVLGRALKAIWAALGPVREAMTEFALRSLQIVVPIMAMVAKALASVLKVATSTNPVVRALVAAIGMFLGVAGAIAVITAAYKAIRLLFVAGPVAAAVRGLASAITMLTAAMMRNPLIAVIVLVIGLLVALATATGAAAKMFDRLTAAINRFLGINSDEILVPELQDSMEYGDKFENSLTKNFKDLKKVFQDSGDALKDSFLLPFDEVYAIAKDLGDVTDDMDAVLDNIFMPEIDMPDYSELYPPTTEDPSKLAEGIMAIVLALAALKALWNTFKDNWKNFWKDPWSGFRNMWDRFVQWWLSIPMWLTGILPAMALAWEGVKTRVGEVVEGIKKRWQEVIEKLGQMWPVPAIAAWGAAVWADLVAALDGIRIKLQQAWQSWLDDARLVWNTFTAWVSGLGAAAWSAIQLGWSTFILNVTTAWTALWAELELQWEGFKAWVSTVPDMILTALKESWATLMEGLAALVTWLGSPEGKTALAVTALAITLAALLFTGLGAAVAAGFATLAGGLTAGFISLPVLIGLAAIGTLAAVVVKNWESIKTGFQNIVDALPGILTSVKERLASAASTLGEKIKTALSGLKTWWDNIWQVPTIKVDTKGTGTSSERATVYQAKAATGAIVTRDQVVRVGERNRPEAILPLSAAGLKPFAEALMSVMPQQSASSPVQPLLYVETLIADDQGLRELERRMNVIRINETMRRGG